MHWSQFQKACSYRLEDEFKQAQFIQIIRQDILGQAISHVIACQTGSWIHSEKPKAMPEYSFLAIKAAVRRLATERMNWNIFFAETGINALRISYEELVSSLDFTMQRVAEHIGITWEPLESELDTEIQRTELASQWREKFISGMNCMHENNGLWRGEYGSSKFDLQLLSK